MPLLFSKPNRLLGEGISKQYRLQKVKKKKKIFLKRKDKEEEVIRNMGWENERNNIQTESRQIKIRKNGFKDFFSVV